MMKTDVLTILVFADGEIKYYIEGVEVPFRWIRGKQFNKVIIL